METEIVIGWQERAPFLSGPMQLVSDLGPSTEFNVFLAGLFWCWSGRRMARVWVVNFVTMYFTSALKLVCHAPRPYWIHEDIRGLTRASGFGMPSGHAWVSAAVWGELARQFALRSVFILAVLIILGVGVSRVYLGVHSAAQVGVGLALGLLVIGLGPTLEARCRPWFEQLSFPKQLGAVFVACWGACLLVMGIRWGLSSYQIPPEWIAMALEKRPQDGPIHPLSLHSPIMSAAGLNGFMVGYLCLERWQKYRDAVSWRQRGWRLLLGGGLLGPYVYATRRFLKGELAVSLPFFAALALDYAYGFTIGLLVSLGIPLLFHRFRI